MFHLSFSLSPIVANWCSHTGLSPAGTGPFFSPGTIDRRVVPYLHRVFANRRFTVYLHVLGSSNETLLLQVVMTVDILVLQSTFNLHTIRCFLYLIRYLGAAVDDTPQGGNALDDDEQFLDYSHILTLPPLPTEFATRHPI